MLFKQLYQNPNFYTLTAIGGFMAPYLPLSIKLIWQVDSYSVNNIPQI